MPALKEVQYALDSLFQIKKYGKDSAFSRFIPAVYEPIEFPWRQFFEADFVNTFNGLMIKGAETVNTIFLAVFPTDDVLEKFISQSKPGDLLFMHHPLVMECGDTRKIWTRLCTYSNARFTNYQRKRTLYLYMSRSNGSSSNIWNKHCDC